MSADGVPSYRPCVGIMLVDARGRAWVGRRSDRELELWQMPQGGIDPGESPREACLRELEEETGICSAVILAESREWRRYEVPADVAPRHWKGRYRGQQQRWFLLAHRGNDAEFDLSGPPGGEAEFSEWRWVELDALCGLIVPFKRDVYAGVIEEFRPRIARHVSG